MRPTLRQLEYILAVADTGQVSLAADKLNVSQPSLSAQIAEVEADLGLKLFTRGRNGAQVTPAGEDVVRRARNIIHDVEDLRASVQGGGLFAGRLRLGVLPSIGPYLLPGVVQRLHKEHPSFRLIIREESTRGLDVGLRSGKLDMIISTPEDHPGADHAHLFTEKLWAACSKNHALSRKSRVKLSDLSGETLLTLGSGHRLSHIVAGLAAKAGGRVSDEYEGTSLDAIRLMAATDIGVAIVPSIYAATEMHRGTDVHLMPIVDKAASRDIMLLSQQNMDQHRGNEVLVDLLRAEASRIMND